MQLVAAAAWSVCWCDCVGKTGKLCKTAELIDMLFGGRVVGLEKLCIRSLTGRRTLEGDMFCTCRNVTLGECTAHSPAQRLQQASAFATMRATRSGDAALCQISFGRLFI